MIRRIGEHDSFGSTRRSHARIEPRGRRRPSRWPTVEQLEGRALLSGAGSPNYTFAPNGDSGGAVRVTYQSSTAFEDQSVTVGEALQPDGKDVTVGSIQNVNFGASTYGDSTSAVARLNTDGTLDTSFGDGGVVNLPGPGVKDASEAVAIQPDGKILVVADIGASTGVTTPEVALYRLNADGTLDTTFGTGGVVDFEFMVGGSPAADSTAKTLTIESDGSILVGGGTGSAVALARFTLTGVADSTFGTDGQVIVTTSAAASGVAALALQADGSIDYATDLTTTPGTQIVVGQLNAAGSVDTTFGTHGQTALASSTAASGYSDDDTAGALAIQSDGKIVVGGYFFSEDTALTSASTHMEVYRVNTDGTVDTTFGTGGEVITQAKTKPLGGIADNAAEDYVNSLLIESSGTIVVGGSEILGALNNGSPTLLGLNTDGTFDVDYGVDGVVAFSSGFDPDLLIPNAFYGLAVESDGKFMASTAFGVDQLLGSGGANDFDEDGISDPAVLLPNISPEPIYAYRPSTGGADVTAYFGQQTPSETLPAPGAYGGAGIDEIAVYMPALGIYAVRSYGTDGDADQLTYIGTPGVGNSIPAPGDYGGNGFTDIGVFEQATATFVYAATNQYGSANPVSVQFGAAGAGQSIPVPADYTGSGQDELGVYFPSLGAFAYRPAGTNGSDDQIVPFGAPGAGQSIPVPGDYDGSGHTELAVYMPALGAFAYRPYGTDGSDDQIIPFGIPGAGQSIPVPGDYDGSGHTELAVYMPSLDALAYRPYGTTGQDDKIIYFGEPGAGNTVPFNSLGASYIEAEGSGGGSGGTGSAGSSSGGSGSNSSGWVDFVPDPAGQAKKKGDDSSSTTATLGQS